jgi:GAF domain-containing protein
MNRLERVRELLRLPRPDETWGLEKLRAYLLDISLLVAASLGGIVYLVNLVASLGSRSLFLALLYTLIYGAVVILAVLRSIPYSTRALGLVVIPYLAGVLSSLSFAFMGDGRVWMAAAVLFAILLLGTWAGLAAALATGGTLLAIGLLMSQGWILTPDVSQMAIPANLGTWGSTTAAYFLIAVILAVTVSTLLAGMQRSLRRQEQIAAHLEEEQADMALSARDLERRVAQLRATAEIARIISGQLETEALLTQAVELVCQRFGLYYVGVFLVDEQGQNAALRAATGEAGQKMLAERHRLVIGGTTMIGQAVAMRKARIAQDTSLEPMRLSSSHLPLTRSELALPLTAGERVIGALTVQSEQPNAFDEDDIAILQGMADALASALENARLFNELQSSLREIQALNRQYIAAAWSAQVESAGDLSYTFENEQAPAGGDPVPLEVPLKLRDQVIGSLVLEGSPRAWTLEDQAVLQAVAAQAAQALDNARLLAQTQHQAQQEQLVSTINTRLRETLDIDTILRTAASELYRAFDLQDITIRLTAENGQEAQR